MKVVVLQNGNKGSSETGKAEIEKDEKGAERAGRRTCQSACTGT